MDISIVITTFNYERYLEECLASCIDQDFCDLEYEIIVVDDGSTDDTNKILLSFIKSIYFILKDIKIRTRTYLHFM